MGVFDRGASGRRCGAAGGVVPVSGPLNKGSIQSNQYSGGAVTVTPRFIRPAADLLCCSTPRSPACPPVLRGPTAGLLALFLALLFASLPALSAQAADASQLLRVTTREIEQQFRRGETAPALQRLDAALAQHPVDAGLRFLKAVMLAEYGRTDEASALLEALTQEFPDLPEPYNNLAVLQAAAGRLEPARALLESALRLDPGYRTAHQNLGDVLVRLAQRAYESATGPRGDPGLQNKLRLARELAAAR